MRQSCQFNAYLTIRLFNILFYGGVIINLSLFSRLVCYNHKDTLIIMNFHSFVRG